MCEDGRVLRTELAVGERARRDAGVAIGAALALAAAFVLVTWFCKESQALNIRQPWQDDPFDVVVSLDYVVLPILLVTGGFRVQLCRRYERLPARRLVDLLRLCVVALFVVLVTEVGEWVAVVLGLHGVAWSALTYWQVAALAVLTVATVRAYMRLRRAAAAVTRLARADDQPDWLADAVNLGLRVGQIVGRHRDQVQTAVRWMDAQVIARIRRHPVAAAALLSALLALPYVAAKVAFEGYPPPLVLISFALPAASLFAFIVVVGSFLRIVAPRHDRVPAWVSAAVVACAAGSVTFAFHDSLLAHGSAVGLAALLFGGGLAAGTVTLTAQLARRRFQTHK